jgi:hypothetical protein
VRSQGGCIHTRAIDGVVYASEFLYCSDCERLHECLVRDVARDGEDLDVWIELSDVGLGECEGVLVQVRDGKFGAFALHECFGDCSTDS